MFTQETFSPIGANSTKALAIFSYTTTDLISDVQVVGYFADKINQLNFGDLIHVNSSNGPVLLRVQTDTSTALNSSNIQSREIILAESFNDQNPSSTDVALQLEFGALQNTPEVTLDALGNFTFNIAGSYLVSLRFQFGRTGNPGSSILFGRVLIDGVQLSSSVFSQLDDGEDVIPTFFRGDINAVVGQVLTVEIYRDSSGVNQGGVLAKTAGLAGWLNAPSCRMLIEVIE